MPRLLVLSGPNGAGKTTFSVRLLPAQDAALPYVNADIEAQRLSPGNADAAAIRAAREVLGTMSAKVARGESFAVETTLSGRHHLTLCRRAVTEGWLVDLHYLALASADLAKRRVAERVAAGGHGIPDDVVVRRYWRGLENLPIYCRTVSRWTIHDNSGAQARLVATGDRDRVIIRDTDRFETIRDVATAQWTRLLNDRTH